jgi:phytoene/squalene synthetase
VVSLLGQKGGEPSDRPDRDAASGADPLRSTHSTFRDLEPPRDDYDRGHARALCAEVARDVLRDFAPGLALLPAATRERVQAVVTYARTLLDFARDRSLEGERLAQINRIEFTLEAALGGEPPGQPVFVELEALERDAPWPREAFDELAKIARSRVSVGLPAKPSAAESQRRRLIAAALHAIVGAPASEELATFAAAIVRAASLATWHEGLWYYRPELGLAADDASSDRFREAIDAERAAILATLDASGGAIAGLPTRLRPAARYARLAAAALARRAAARPDSPCAPTLSAGTRLRYLLLARLSV